MSAGVHLARKGWQVTLLDRRDRPGGRVRRFAPGKGMDPIDWGQHLMLGCYRATIGLTDILGTRGLLKAVSGVTPFISPGGRVHPYRLGRLPAPFHALPGLFGLTQLSFPERLALGRAVAAAKLSVRLNPAALDSKSAARWLMENGQGPSSVEGFWGPLILATLNADPYEASALMLATVIDRGFFAWRSDAVPMLPATTLHDALVGPAVDYLNARGGGVLTGKKASGVVMDGAGMARAVVASDGSEYKADAFVLAVPSWDLPELARGVMPLAAPSEKASRLLPSPIVSVELWYDRPWLVYPYAGVLGGRTQWVFGHKGGGRMGLWRVSAVTSAAGAVTGGDNAATVASCVAELKDRFPMARSAKLMGSVVVREPRATIKAGTGQAGLRPVAKTGISNLFLAGDWTATGLPATIEGAVMSGRTAAGQITQQRNVQTCG